MDFMQILVGSIGILAFILIPGIALSLAFFPRKQDIGTVERIGMSLLFGVVPTFIQYFLDKNFSIPINTANTYLILEAVTALGIMIWIIRLKFTGKKETAQAGA
jgi:uncharacterized membrane protein